MGEILSDKLSFLDGGETAAPASTAASNEPVAAPAPAPVAPEAPAAPNEPAQAPQAPQDPMVPLRGMLDEREKRQAIQRQYEAEQQRAADLERRLAALQQQPVEVPDMFGDPDGFRTHIQAQASRQLWETKVGMSQVMAEQQFGKSTVDEALAEFQRQCPPGSPQALEMQTSAHPVGFIVQWQKRNKLLADVGDDPDAYVKRRAAELGLIPQADPGIQQQPIAANQPAQPIRQGPLTIANAPSAGGGVPRAPIGPGTAFEAVFKR